ncbi:MAG TPA: glutamate--tRNA ligase [Candidatus Saccharibacteria bacterium]|nr:glutamate--tRNA ligase [Candidatus Saccharibacteria bacterium]
MHNITTRFAPSPTGFIHVGGVRTALFAWLLAWQKGGTFILRIEDTDKQREVAGAEQHIIKSLQWLGIEWDEGPDKPGPHQPYRQSERLLLYADWAQRLVASGRAYADPYTPAQVAAFREEAKRNKQPFLYRNHRPKNPPKWDGTQPLRFTSSPKAYAWHDEVLGELSAGEDAVDDFILMKSDGYPTYNFCHIVDDSLMDVNLVIRSQEFIASVPKFLNLYEALSVPIPTFATLPYVMAMNGNKKLSKRDGAKDILDYQNEGYLPEAMLNFLATLGWNDGTEQEIFSKEELIKKFSLDKVQKSPARFDEKRLLWLNGQWIRRIDTDDLYNRVQPFLPSSASSYSGTYKREVVALAQGRLKTLADIQAVAASFFEQPVPKPELVLAHKQLSKLSPAVLSSLLAKTQSALQQQADFSIESIQDCLNSLLESTHQKPVILFSLIRLATTWAEYSPDLAPSLALLGKDEVMQRLSKAEKYFDSIV